MLTETTQESALEVLEPEYRLTENQLEAFFNRSCQDCGGQHQTGGQALACDHRLGIERWAGLVGGMHSRHQVRGCPLCEDDDDC